MIIEHERLKRQRQIGMEKQPLIWVNLPALIRLSSSCIGMG